MKISKKSWHYRLIDFAGWDHPRSLCAYFWFVVFAPIKILVFALAALLAVVVCVGPFAQLVIDAPFVWVLFGGTLDVALLTALLIHLVMERRYQARHERIMRGENIWARKERKPSLLREWLRAKHEKVCPMLEFDW